MSGSVLILGATSSIARAAAAAFANRDHPLYLAARDVSELDRIASDLRIKYGVHVEKGHFDAENYGSHGKFLETVIQQMGDLYGVLLAFGYMCDQQMAERDSQASELIIARNFTGAVSVLNHCASYFETRRSGFIIGITSVAGDRGRQSNYLYGSAKGALSLYLQGLQNRLYPAGVRVITVKPGFVDTAMTFGKPGLFLVASPQYVGEKIVRALDKSKDVVYLPWFWRYIMWIIKMIPEPIFKRLKL